MPYLAGFITPQDYGALGNGTNDDTAAIQSALNAVSSNGSTVFFPAGTYKITSSLTASVNGTQIVGGGWGSQILYDGSVVTTGAIKASGNIRLFVRDIRISQSNASHLGTAMDVSQCNNSVFERLLIDGGGGSGVSPLVGILLNASTCNNNTIRNSRISYGGTNSIGINIIGNSNSNTVQDVRLVPQGDTSGSSGIHINTAHSNLLIHPDVESAAGNGVFLDTAAHGTTMVKPFMSAVNIGVSIASGVVGTSLYGGTIQGSTTAAVQDLGTATQIFNAWPNSGSNTYNHLSLPNTDQFLINGIQVPGNTFTSQDQGGLIAWGFDPTQCGGSTITVSGTVYLMKIVIRYATTISKAMLSIVTSASGVVANQSYMGLYTSAGTRVAVTAAGALDTLITGSGPITATFTSPYAAAAGTYWVAFVNNATTPVELARGTGFSSTPNANLTAANYRWAVNGTGQTSLPASITPASNSLSGNITLWTGVL